MNSSELRSAVRRLQSQTASQEIVTRWQNFHQNAISSWRSRNRQNVGQVVDELKSALAQIDLTVFPLAQQRALQAIEAHEYFGKPMIEQIDAIIDRQSFDPEGSAQKLEQLKAKVDRFFSMLGQLESVLQDSNVPLSSEKNFATLQILFSKDSDTHSVADLAGGIKSWDLILGSFGRLLDVRTEDLKVISVHKASPLVLEISAPIGYIGAIGLGCSLILAGLEKYLKLKRAMAEIRSIELGNKKLEQELESQSDGMRDKLATEVAERLAADFKKTKDGETKNAIKIAIDKLYVFIEKGGEVSARSPENVQNVSESEKATLAQIEKTFLEIRKIEQTIGQRLLTGDASGTPPGST